MMGKKRNDFPQKQSSPALGSSQDSAGSVNSIDAASETVPSAFEKALQKCVADLSEDDKAAFKSAEDVMRKIQLLNKEESKPRLESSLSDRVQKVLEFVRQFMDSIQTFIQYSPEISSLAVGGVNCVLSLVLEFFEFFEHFMETMEWIGEHLIHLSNYGKEVFLQSQEVQKALVNTYSDLLEFFVMMRQFVLRHAIFTSQLDSRGFHIFLKTTWEPFEMKLKPIEERFFHHTLIVVRTANALNLVRKYGAHAKRSSQQEDNHRRDVLNWLSPIDCDETHERHWTKRYENTGSWLTDDGRFTAWRDTRKSQLVWCHGAPGTGKTVLASLVVEHLLRTYELSNNTGVTFLYCDYKEPREPLTYIRLAIKQLCRRMERLPDELFTLYNTHFRRHSEPNLRELQYLFVRIIDYFDSTVFLVLDALDECSVDQRRVLMNFLKGSIKSTQDNQTSVNGKDATVLKVFVTSRREEDIRCAISSSAFPTIDIEINASRVNADIEIYVTKELDRLLSDGSLVLQDPSLNDEIRRALIGKADGIFLWVDFQLKAICDQASDNRVRSMLRSLPKDLEETYERIINMIRSPQSVLASRVLMWIAYAERPLRVEEMVFAVAIEKDTKDVETLTSMLPPAETILAACTNLVIVDGNGYLRFVHFSVQEFLLNGRSNVFRPPGVLGCELAHLEMAQRCIIFLVLYLTYFQKSDYGYPILFKDSSDTLPSFFQYTLYSWHYHCRSLPAHYLSTHEIFPFISSLFEHGPLLSLHRNSSENDATTFARVENYKNSVYSPATLALIFGLPSLATKLSVLNRKHVIGKPHAHYVNEDLAIHFAVVQDSQLALKHLCEAGYPINVNTGNIPPLAHVRSVAMAKLLVKNGANVNAQGGVYGNALQAAVSKGNVDIVQLLLEEGADLHAQGGYYGNALQAATSEGNLKVVQLLLQKGADVNAHGGYYGNPLQAAAYKGSRELVEMLLEKGADVNAQGGHYGTALQAALSQNNWEIVKLLLREGADVNVQGGEDGNALQVAVLRGNWRILIELLMQKDVDVNASGGYFGNALQAAASVGIREIVELLLQKDANVNAQGGYYGTALQAAVTERNLEIVELLLQKGADVNVQGGYYGNPLQAATYRGDWEIGRLLLQKGADVNAQGGYYGNSLQAAVCRGEGEVVEMLLQKGADINAQGGVYGNLLQAVLARNEQEVLELLLQKSADLDVNAQGGVYGTALQAAASEGNLEAVELLLQKGADVNAQGGYYGNALQAAVSKRHQDLLELLLEEGADVNAQGGYYGNALQAAVASEGNLEVVELLLQKGADVNAQGGYYGNALQAAASQRNLKLLELLLQNGADVNAKGGIHWSILQAAIHHGPMESIKVLLEAGADVNAQGGKYGNALRMAAAMGAMSIVNALAERGACVELEDSETSVTLSDENFENWHSPSS